MQTRDGIKFMAVPETEIDIVKFEHVHSEGNLVFGKYKGIDTVVDRRKQVFCHFATCRTFSCYGNDDYAYRRWGCVEKEEQYEFYDYRINGQVSKKHTFTKGTCFKVLHLGFSIQIYAQFPTYGYLGSEMCNTIKTSDKNEEATGYVGYKLNRDTEINIDKFKLTTIVNDMVFGIYNNEHVSIDRHYAVFCMFVDVTLDNAPSAFTTGKWYKVNNTGDFVVTVDQQHWLFSKNATVPKGSVVKFDRRESGTGYTMKIQVADRGLAYFGTELFNKIEPVKEEPMTKEQTNSPSFTLSDMLTQSNVGDVVGVYGPNETTVFVKRKEPALLNSYVCDAKGNKWVLSNRNLKPVNRNDVSPKQMERVLTKEEAIQAGKETDALLGTAVKSDKKKTNPIDDLLKFANEMSAMSLFKRICKQTGLEYPDVPTETFIRKAFSKIRELDVTVARVNLVEEAAITFLNGDNFVLFLETSTGLIYKEFTPAKQENKLTEQTTNKMTTPDKQDYFKAALKADEQFSIDSNAKYVKSDYEKGWLQNYKLVKTPKVVKPIEKEPVVISHVLNTVDDLCNNTIPAKFCLITDTKQVYQMLSELEYKQYRQSQFAKGNPVVESIIDKADQIWVKISM